MSGALGYADVPLSMGAAGAARTVSDAPAAATVFAALWESLADLLGTAATATLLRRALRDAAATGVDVGGLKIDRDDLTHRYELPASWSTPGDGASRAALGAVAVGLRPLLLELTGSVVLRRLERLEGLAEMAGLVQEAR